ncbi:MAG: alpha/beta hydrolase [Chlorobia bacterium]|nr:alpha/beta hydrolase [Fimbriimonadaceae bacterium]
MSLLTTLACGKGGDQPEAMAMGQSQQLDVSVRKDIAYVENGGPDQTYDIYAPTANPTVSPPLLVFVHGGAWQSGDKRDYAALGNAFANAGIVSAVVNYRLSPTVQHPAHVEDVALALGHLAKYAQGYDPKRIFVMGHSAGAHVCGLLAAMPKLLEKAGMTKDQLPKGFIGLEGIYDIQNLIKVWPTYRNWFIEKAFGKDDKWAAASPTRLPIELKSRWLLVHAKGDELVDMAQTKDFMNHLSKAGVELDSHDPGQLSHDGVVRAYSDPKSDLFKKAVAFVTFK